MTTSAPFRSVSLCQTYSACSPRTSLAAWYASSSQLLPGKTMTENVTLYSPASSVDSRPRASVHFNPVALNHRVGQQLVGDFRSERPGLRRFGRRQIELEGFPLPDDGVAERMQGVGDGLALRIEHRWFERHENARAHAV